MSGHLTEGEFKKLRLPNLKQPVQHAPRAPRKKPQYKTGESRVKAACMGWLAINHVTAWRNNTGKLKDEHGSWVSFGKVGSADIIGLTKRTGRHLEIECKSTDGEQSPEQVAHMRLIRQSGGLYIIARSLEDLIDHKAEILS